MTQRKRKLIGTIALILMITVYALLAMLVAAILEVHTTAKWVEFAYYLIAGLLWVLPAGWLISWMAKPDATAAKPAAHKKT